MKYEHNPEDFDAHYEKRIADLDKQLHQTQAEAAGMRAALERILRDYEHESEPDFLFKALSGEAGKAYLERSAQMAKANQDTIANLIQDRDRLKGELEATAKRVMELDVLEIIEELDEVTKQRDQAKAERDELWGLSHKLRAELGEIKSELWAGQLGQRRLKDLVAVRSENIQLRKDVADAQARWSTLNDELREATQRLVGAVQERDAAMEEARINKEDQMSAERELEDLAEAERQIESWRGHANTYQTAQREAEQRAEKAEKQLAELTGFDMKSRYIHLDELAKAVAVEREECAKVADDDCAWGTAAAIRAGFHVRGKG